MNHVDFSSVIVAAIVYMIIRSLWYSHVLFGESLCVINKRERRNKYIGYVLSFFNACLLAYFISLIEIYVDATSFWDGIVVGFILWLGFVFTTQIPEVIWKKKNYKIFLLKNSFLLLAFLFMGAVLVG
jgi:hypothetical protein